MVDFMTQVGRLGAHMTTREEIFGYFQERYKGPKEQWKSELAKALSPYTSGKNGQPIAPKNVRRRLEGSRLKSPLTAKTKKEYEELGKHLPRKRPERGYHVKGTVCVNVAGYGCEQRTWDFKVVGEGADYLNKTGSLQALVNLYMGEVPDEENPEAEACDEDACKPSIRVYALSERGARGLPNIDGSR